MNDFGGYVNIMKALSDETRIKIIEMLSQGERCACKLLDDLSISQPTLSYHMKILCDSGLVEGQRSGIWMRYSINAKVFTELNGFITRIISRCEQTNIDCKGTCQ